MISTFDFVASCAARIREHGYVNGTDAEKEGIRTTGKQVLADMLESNGCAPESYGVTEDDEQAAEEALAWIRDLPETEREKGYLRKLYKVADEANVSFNGANMLASLLRTYFDQMERAANAQDYSGSEFVGTPGERTMFLATVREIRTGIRNRFNPDKPNTLIHFTDAKGNLLVWFTTKAVGFDVGDELPIEAKVKRHEERDGIKQTQISYVRS